jgi:hypothetical protein
VGAVPILRASVVWHAAVDSGGAACWLAVGDRAFSVSVQHVQCDALQLSAPGGTHTGDIRRVIRSAGNLCLWHRL